MRNKPQSPVEILEQIALELEYFKAKNGVVYCTIEANASLETVPVKSEVFKKYLLYQMHRQGETISSEGLNNVIDLLLAKAMFEAEEVETAHRVGQNKDTFYYDLGSHTGEYVKITSKGYAIVKNSPIVFLRSKSSLAQRKPALSEKINVWSLQKYFNTANDNDFFLLLVYILSCYIPNVPHHILILLGCQGSAKSTVSRMIKALVDPSEIGISTMPRNQEDLILQLHSEYLFAFDNLKEIRGVLNDIFCQVSTGGSLTKRALYTDDELVTYSFQRCLILNGISFLSSQSDLLDRSIVISLEKISSSKRKTETQIFKDFYNDLPYILHSFFETIAMAKRIHRSLEIDNLPRMADAVTWQCAISEALGIDHNEYLAIYSKNQQCVNQEVLSENPVAEVIMLFMAKRKFWSGSVTDLFDELKDLAALKNCDNMFCVKSASSLSRKLGQLKVNLEAVGIKFEIVNTGKCKEIKLKKMN